MRTKRATLLKALLSTSVAIGGLLGFQPQASAEVGVAAAVNIDARGRPPGASPRVLALGNNIVFKEEIQTDDNGLVQILLLDGTTFTVGPNSLLTIDEFVFNPNSGDAKVVASLTKGAFRFVGARTSQTEGGVAIKTPVGTIGVRGGLLTYLPASESGEQKVLCGQGTCTLDNGGVSVTFNAGQTAVISADGSGKTEVHATTAEEAQQAQASLATEGDGGSGEPLTEGDVAASGIEEQGSAGAPPAGGSITSAAVSGGDEGEVVARAADSPDGVTEPSGTELIAKDDELEEQVDGPPPPTKNARVLTVAAGGYVQSNIGEVFDRPGERGLVGSTAGSDRIIGFFRDNGRLISGDRTINLPDFTGTAGDIALANIAVSDGISPAGPLSGVAYAGTGDFVAYLLRANGDVTQPFFTIYGTPTNEAALGAIETGTDIREYMLTPDPLRPSAVPFFRDEVYGTLTGSLNSSNFLVVEPGVGDDIRALQTWINISGSGLNQKSGVGVVADQFYENDDGQLQFFASRRGSFRSDSLVGAATLGGAIQTIAGADGNTLYGPNAQHFVIGAGNNPADSHYDSFFDGPPGGSAYRDDPHFGTTQVASLATETPQVTFARTSRAMTGFMSGMMESDEDGAENPYIVQSVGAPNLTVNLDATNNRVFAQTELFDWLDQNSVAAGYRVTFGEGAGGYGQDTFVDDGRYGATQNDNPDNIVLFTDGGDEVPSTVEYSSNSYFVSGRANPIPGYQICPASSCNYIDWGFWGTKVEIEGGASPEVPNYRSDTVHLGTWVAGDISTQIEVFNGPILPFNGYATFDGVAMGTVARYTPDGVAKYIATGGIHLAYDFAIRSGTVNISNFDGMNLSGSLYDTSDAAAAKVFSYLTDDDGGDLTGTLEAAFVNNGATTAAGVIGDFDIVGEDVSAVGSFGAGGQAATRVYYARVLTAPDVYEIEPDFGGGSVPVPGSRGLVGSKPAYDRDIGLTRNASNQLVSQDNTITITDVTGVQGDTTLQQLTVSGSAPEGPLSGIAYSGVDDFAFYYLHANGDPNQLYYVLTGTPTDMTRLAAQENFTDIATYTLTRDPRQNAPVPFFNTDLYGPVANYSLTDLLVVEPSQSSSGTSRGFVSWIDIQGVGFSQKSAAVVSLPEIFEDEFGVFKIDASRRGSFRHDAFSIAASTRGGVASMAGPTGEHFFGPDAQHFVLGVGTDPADVYSEALYGPAFSGNPNDGYLGDGVFGTQHVASLVDEVPQTDFSRTTRDVGGYMAGMFQSDQEQVNAPYAMRSVMPTLAMHLDAVDNTVSASSTVFDVEGHNPVVDAYVMNFGRVGTENGPSTFVDDNNFGALRNRNAENTRVITDGGANIPQTTAFTAGSYLVSGRAVPLAGYEHCSTCDFLDWGWWGTDIGVDPGSSAETPNGRRDFAHMGTWVAGDISTPAEIYNPSALPFGGSASYQGTALGTVSRDAGGGDIGTYIAKGDVSMNFDFGSQLGNFGIDFDGMNASGTIADTGLFSSATGVYAGSLNGTDLLAGSVSGSVSGAFANDGPNVASGILGDFSLSGAGVSAVGTFAGIESSGF